MSNPRESAFLGALVADAASVGLHWIYDFDHLNGLVAAGGAEFRTPKKADYDGVFGFFAHGAKVSGDQSHYGEALLIAAESMADGGEPNVRTFQNKFRDHFGAGGPFVGYIDHPTRETLQNLAKAEKDSAESAIAAAGSLKPEIARVVIQKVTPYTRYLTGEALVGPVTRAIQVTYSEPDVLAVALKVAEAMDRSKPDASGAVDEQAPAAASLAALALRPNGASAERRDVVRRTVRVTNNSETAVGFALFVFDFLVELQGGASAEAAFASACARSTDAGVVAAVTRGWEHSLEPLKETSSELGRTCYLKETVPLALCVFRRTTSFRDAINVNIRAGGDSCGRALMLGSWAGALYGLGGEKGVPAAWLLRLRAGARIAAALEGATPAPTQQ